MVRGVRPLTDLAGEFTMMMANKHLDPGIETVFLMAEPRSQAIASRLVKEIAMLGGDVKPFTSPYVADLLAKRCNELRKK